MRTRTFVPSALALLATILLGGCASMQRTAGESKTGDRLELLADRLSGSFSSTAQAQADPDFRDIRLRMCRIWPERTDGPWLYVEQAEASAMEKPYRQRVYRLAATGPQAFVSHVYEIPDPSRFVGACGRDASLAGLTPDALTTKDGCAVFLTYHVCSDLFTGETQGKGCASTLRGAAYATSEVSITQAGIVSWDRGFDAAGQQVWGATKGGYRFVRDGVQAH